MYIWKNIYYLFNSSVLPYEKKLMLFISLFLTSKSKVLKIVLFCIRLLFFLSVKTALTNSFPIELLSSKALIILFLFLSLYERV